MMPYLWMISLLSFYFHATLLIGDLPKYNQPDPKTISIYTSYSPIIDFLSNVWIISFLLSLALILVYVIKFRKRINWALIIIIISGQVLAIMLFFSGIMEWYAD